MKPVVIHSEAHAELDAAMAAYERQKPGLGLDLEAAVEQAVALIQQMPQIGSPYRATEFRYQVLRRFPYVLYYAELEDVIWVVAVAHGGRRPGYWRQRQKE